MESEKFLMCRNEIMDVLKKYGAEYFRRTYPLFPLVMILAIGGYFL